VLLDSIAVAAALDHAAAPQRSFGNCDSDETWECTLSSKLLGHGSESAEWMQVIVCIPILVSEVRALILTESRGIEGQLEIQFDD
jgi:hypothetical protein